MNTNEPTTDIEQDSNFNSPLLDDFISKNQYAKTWSCRITDNLEDIAGGLRSIERFGESVLDKIENVAFDIWENIEMHYVSRQIKRAQQKALALAEKNRKREIQKTVHSYFKGIRDFNNGVYSDFLRMSPSEYFSKIKINSALQQDKFGRKQRQQHTIRYKFDKKQDQVDNKQVSE